MLDIARGLEYLHLRDPSIIHRDVCPPLHFLCYYTTLLVILDWTNMTVQIVQHTHQPCRSSQSRRFRARACQTFYTLDDPESGRDCQLAGTRAVEAESEVRLQGRRVQCCSGLLGDDVWLDK
jgi:hypothetical protein